MLLKPRWDNNLAFGHTVNDFSSDPQTSTNRSVEFDPDIDWVPRVAVGFRMGDGLGFRVRWWQGSWSDSQSGSVPGGDFAFGVIESISSANPLNLGISTTSSQITGPEGATLAPASVVANSKLSMVAWDFEATKETKICGFDLTLSGGFRYMHISQDYSMFISAPDASINSAQGIISGHNINGFGPTFAIDGRYGFGGGIAAYGVARFAVLFADAKQNAFAAYEVPGIEGGNVGRIDSAFQDRNTVIPLTELEVGGEYAASMGNSELFVRIGLVGNVYFSAGNSSRSGNTANEANSNLGLIGINFSGGVRF